MIVIVCKTTSQGVLTEEEIGHCPRIKNDNTHKHTLYCFAPPVWHTFVKGTYLGLIIYQGFNRRGVNKLENTPIFTPSYSHCVVKQWLVGTKAQWSSTPPLSGQHQLTSKPCFSDGTHTSLLAAQSAWLAAENTELEVGDPGAAPDDRKRVTSLTPPPVGLDMVLLALGKGDTQKGGWGAIKS